MEVNKKKTTVLYQLCKVTEDCSHYFLARKSDLSASLASTEQGDQRGAGAALQPAALCFSDYRNFIPAPRSAFEPGSCQGCRGMGYTASTTQTAGRASGSPRKIRSVLPAGAQGKSELKGETGALGVGGSKEQGSFMVTLSP